MTKKRNFLFLLFANTFVVGLFCLLAEKALAAGLGDSITGAVHGSEKDIQLGALINTFYIILSSVTMTAAIIAGLLGSYMYMASGGDPKKLSSAKEIVARAAIGMLVVALAYVFFKSIGVSAPNP